MLPTKKNATNVMTAKSLSPQELIDEKILALKERICALGGQSPALEEQMRTLKTERNLEAPISKFPPEVLSNIFTCVRDMACITRSCRDWTSFTYVCRLWRQVALDDPSLWTRLDLTSQAWFDETLKRSKSAPIWIAHESYEGDMSILRKAMAYSERCSALYIDRQRPIDDGLMGEFNKLGRHMRSLRLDVRIRFPRDFLPRIGSQLHYVHFALCNFDWTSLYTSVIQVSYLSISNPRSYANPMELLNYLKTTTRLEHLRLVDVLDSYGSALLADISPGSVVLPRLQHLCLDGEDFRCDAPFFSALRYPNDAQVIFNSTASKRDDIRWLMDTILKHRDPEVGIDLTLRRTTGLKMNVSSTSKNDPFTRIFLGLYEPSLLLVACLSLPLSNLQRVVMLKSDIPTMSTFLPMLKSLENLRTLIVEGNGSEYFLNKIPTDPIGLGENGLYPFPRLKTLEIWGADFERIDCDALCMALELRKEYGLELDEFVCDNCCNAFTMDMKVGSKNFIWKDDSSPKVCEYSFPDLFY